MKISSPKVKTHAVTVRIAMRGDVTTVSSKGAEEPAELLAALYRAVDLVESAQKTDVDSGQGELLQDAA